MKGGHNKKSVRVEFVMSEPEAELEKNAWRNLALPTCRHICERWP